MCEELEISRDAYYKWLKRKGTKNIYEINNIENKCIFIENGEIFEKNKNYFNIGKL